MSALRVLMCFCATVFGYGVTGCMTSNETDKGGLASRFDVRKEINRRIVFPYDDSQDVEIFIASNRKAGVATSASCSASFFSIDMGDGMRYGRCAVHVPRTRFVGVIEPVGVGLNAHDHFQIRNHSEAIKDDFFAQLKSNPGDEVLVFVHGFNIRFDEALIRASQLAFDTKFQGPFILFSWPAGPKDGFVSSLRFNKTYEHNRGAALNSIEVFREFLAAIAQTGKKINLLVHSMGHQIVIPAIAKHVRETQSSKFLGEVIFNAPDFASTDFESVRADILTSADRVTLYCSPNDNALVASRSFNGNRRLGMCEKAEGVDVISVKEVDSPTLGVAGLGHGYYSGRVVLTDIFQVLLGIDAPKRLFVRRADEGALEQYVLRP